MSRNAFGGAWTVDKLDVLARYLDFYTTALRAQPTADRPFRLLYIDAFAGNGRCVIRERNAGQREIEGSASRALSTAHPMAGYHFIERKVKHVRSLNRLLELHPLRTRCQVHQGTAQEKLPPLLESTDWSRHRAVLFLDPFGLECDWGLLERVCATKAIDVFFLLSVSGLFRNATIDSGALVEEKAAALTRVLGTSDWRQAWYAPPSQGDFFREQQADRRAVDWCEIVRYCTKRLRTLFPEVLEPRILRNETNAPLFALYLAVSNPNSKAKELARRVGRDILTRLS